MDFFPSFLTFLGEHFSLILIGCLELILAILLIIRLPKKLPKKVRTPASKEVEQVLLQGLNQNPHMACVVVQRADQLPCFCLGNLSGLLGISLSELQTDISCMLSRLLNPEEGRRFWLGYCQWDGSTPLSTELKMDDQSWFSIEACRCPNSAYDLFFLRSITKEKQREEKSQEQLQQAEETSQFKTSFLFRMSHEIRTPMNGITGMLTLAEGKLPPNHPAMQYLDKANELSDHLLTLINDILDMSRIEAGKIELEEQPFSLYDFAAKLYDMFAKTLESKGVHYAVERSNLAANWVIGDELRVSQVIINFLSNAVKFTSEGEVTVTFRQMALKNDRLELMIRVHDTGIGMKPEFISHIFRPFEQEDASTTRRFGGTGLGMAISDQLVKLMGGQIVVESVPGKGSDFSVFLSFPVTEPPKSAQPAAIAQKSVDAQEARSCRILLAEDNEINAMIAVEILEEKGAQVEVAEDGQKAVEQFTAHPAGYYDLILMDIQMPVMDGRTAARTIRKLDRPDAAKIPIFALSADAFVEDVRLSKESGMNQHISKPIDFENLWNLIQNAVNAKEHENS